MSKVTKAELEAAHSVYLRHYRRDWVWDEVDTLAEEIFSGRIEDREQLIERMEESTGSTVNTASTQDQQMIVWISDRSSEGRSEWEELDYEVLEAFPPRRGVERVGPPLEDWALNTLRVDVREQLEAVGLDLNNEFDRAAWCRAVAKGDHSEELAMRWDQFVQRNGEPEWLAEGAREERTPTELADGDRPTAAELRQLPTIREGHNDNLKLENERFRAWITREPGMNTVLIEERRRGRWVTVEEYEG